jgi:uroporphyrinogen III methyltransferase/synthase
LRRALERKGARVLELPTIAIVPPRSWRRADQALRRLPGYDWLIFTSANGVKSFFDRLEQLRKGKGVRTAWKRLKIAAIGPATASALRQHGLRPRVVPREYRAEGLLRALQKRPWHGKRVLLARAAQARDLLPQRLRRWGARVDVVAVYRTRLPRRSRGSLRRVFGGGRSKPDVITFTSSSTVRNFCALLGAQAARQVGAGVAVATIGPITSRTARELGLRVAVEAKRYTIPGLIKAIEKYFRGRRPAIRDPWKRKPRSYISGR